MKDIVKKSFFLQAKSVGDKGQVRAVIATMGVVDKDGDVTLPGFFGVQGSAVVPVHDWDHVPIGKATISEQGNEAIADIKINLDIQAARDWFSAMKFDLENGEPLIEWSYGFKVLEGGQSMGDFEGQQVRFLKPVGDGKAGCEIYEVSPVMVGAGEGTRTLAAKGVDGEGKRFVDEAKAVLDAVANLAKRGQSLADLRAKEGRALSAANRELLKSLGDSLQKAAVDLEALAKVPETGPDPKVEARKEWARYLQSGGVLPTTQP